MSTLSRAVTKTATPKKSPVIVPSIIRLTRIKNFYIPVDAESYRIMRDAGVPLLQIHTDFLPTLAPLLKKRKVRAREVHFRDEILNPFLEKVADRWNKKPNCKATIGTRTMVFQTTSAMAYAAARESLPKLEQVLIRFFQQYGYRTTFTPSEQRGKLKLVVDYWFDATKMPIITLEGEVQESKPVYWKIGFTRLGFKFDNFHTTTISGEKDKITGVAEKIHKIGYVHLTVEVSQGGVFKAIHSTRCTFTELSSVKPLMVALMNVPNLDPHNFDNQAE